MLSRNYSEYDQKNDVMCYKLKKVDNHSQKVPGQKNIKHIARKTY